MENSNDWASFNHGHVPMTFFYCIFFFFLFFSPFRFRNFFFYSPPTKRVSGFHGNLEPRNPGPAAFSGRIHREWYGRSLFTYSTETFHFNTLNFLYHYTFHNTSHHVLPALHLFTLSSHLLMHLFCSHPGQEVRSK